MSQGDAPFSAGAPPNYYDYVNPAPSAFQSLDPRLNYSVSQPSSSTEPPPAYYVENQHYDLTLSPAEIAVEQKSDDELYIETWLSKIGKIHINLDSTVEFIRSERKLPRNVKPNIKIGSAKQSLRKCLQVIEKLEETQSDLETNVETMSSHDWKRKTIDIGNLKHEFTSLMSQFENEHLLLQLGKLVAKRAKKRLSQKRRRTNRRNERSSRLERRKTAHKEIDDWLEGMKDAVERTKAEESMKRDADCVLAEVTKKRSDARKQLSLISALIKLRNVREGIAAQRGERTPPEDKSAFNTVTEKLTNMWEDVSKVYAKEEHGLKVMLERNAGGGGDARRTTKAQRTAEQWEYCVFGPKSVPSHAYWGLTSAEKGVETFVAIRKSWDTFLAKAGDERGSRIPVGWVLPSGGASENWTKYLCDNYNL